jgi:hypothetical protein
MQFRIVSLVIVVLATSAAACNKDKTPTAPSTSVIALSGNLSFGSVTVGQTSTAQLTINNTGNADLTITGVSYPTGFSGSFNTGTIAAGASQAVTVTFAPTAAQAYTGNITVTGNQSSGTNSIAVSGTGTAIATFTLSGIVTESAPTTSIVLAGARVEFVDGANQGKFATTGSDGRYQITGVVNGGFTVRATLAGYTTAMLPVGVNGNTTLDIRLDPTAARTQFGSGQYRVGVDMPAGRYYADPANECHWQRLRGFGGTTAEVIADSFINFDAEQWIVDLLATDVGFQTDSRCNVWSTTPRRGLLTGITPGLWIIGAQITPGTYRTDSAAQGCFWQRVSNFSGAGDAVIANGLTTSAGPQLVTIAGTDAGFSTNALCGTWTVASP